MEIINFVLTPKNIRKHALYTLIAVVFCVMITSKIYVRLFGDFDLTPLSDLKGVKDYFTSGRFVLSITLFFIVYKVFFSAIDFILFNVCVKGADKLYDKFRSLNIDLNKKEFHGLTKGDIDLWIVRFVFKRFKEIGVIDVDNGTIKQGIHFKETLRFFKGLYKGKKTIDSDLAYIPLAVVFMFCILFNTVVVDNFDVSVWQQVFVNIACAVIMILQTIKYFLNVFIEMKYDKIYLFLKRVESGKYLKDE